MEYGRRAAAFTIRPKLLLRQHYTPEMAFLSRMETERSRSRH